MFEVRYSWMLRCQKLAVPQNPVQYKGESPTRKVSTKWVPFGPEGYKQLC